MDITKLLPLLLMASQNSGGDNNNLNKLLPELLKAQGGDQNALTGMLLNMLSNNFNKQNAGCKNEQNKQNNMQQSEFNSTINNSQQNNYATIKNYKNFYAPSESNSPHIAEPKQEKCETQNAEAIKCEQCANNVYPKSDIDASVKKNSVDNNATNVKTPFGYTRLY